eukprot:g1533.t1
MSNMHGTREEPTREAGGQELTRQQSTLLSPREIKERRRADRLRKVHTDEPNLHKLFRLFDGDNDQFVTINEFQTGLLAMGYKEANDMAVVDRIMRVIDTDSSGRINEDEFVTYFMQRKLDELQSTLKQLQQEDCASSSSVRIIDYGVRDGEFADSGVMRMDRQADRQRLSTLLLSPADETRRWLAPRRWIDVNGYHHKTMELLSQQLGLHEETAKDAGVFQRQKFEVLTPGASSESHDEIAGKAAAPASASPLPQRQARPTLSNPASQERQPLSPSPQPLSPRRPHAQHAVLLVHSLSASPCVCAKSASIGDTASEATDATFTRLGKRPSPMLSASQRTIFVVGDDVVITVLQEHDGESDPWVELRERLHDHLSDVRVNSNSGKYLAMALLELVLDGNFELRDELRGWLRLLEGEIRRNAAQFHVEHLYAFSTLAEAYVAELLPLADALSLFDEEGSAVTAALENPGDSPACGMAAPTPRSGGGHDHISNPHKRLGALLSRSSGSGRDGVGGETMVSPRADQQPGGSARSVAVARRAQTALTCSLPRFFREQHIFFKDLSDEVATIRHETIGLLHKSRHLHDFYRTIQDDRMNRTLYILTLVTAIFVPAQFLTGLYGMNFEYMPELEWKYSYAVFWAVIVVLSGLIVWALRSTFNLETTTVDKRGETD